MTRLKITAISTCMLAGISAAALLLSMNISAETSTAKIPDALQSVPSDYAFVAGLNVQSLTASPLYVKLRQDKEQEAQIGAALSQFTEQTGIDPVRDISYLLIAGRPDSSAEPGGLVILSGNFDRTRLISFLQTEASAIPMDYEGNSVMMIPDKKDNSVKNAMAFLDLHEIALGNLVSIKAALDTRAGKRESILSNNTVASLFSGINMNAMIWFAADAPGVMKQPPLPLPPALNMSAIRSVVGTIDLGEDFAGTMTATTVDSSSAAKLADVFKGLLALAQLSGDRNPGLKSLLNTVTVMQDASKISLSFNIPGDLIQKLGRDQGMRRKTI